MYKQHSIFEDFLALITSALLASLGIFFFKSCGFLTGGVAGIALSLSMLSPLSFGAIFFLLNLPCYYLAWRHMSKRFTLNTFVSVTLVSLMSDQIHRVISVSHLQPLYAAVLGGFLVGMAILIMFRHGSSLGGLGIIAQYCHSRWGWDIGRFQMLVDVAIVIVGFFLVSLPILLYSVVGAIAVNSIIAMNHKPGRYQIT